MSDRETERRNAATARRYFEVVYNARRPDRIGEFAHPDGVAYQTCGVLVGRDVVREVVAERFLSAFPDLRIEVAAVLSRGDQTVVRWKATGTHAGPGLGMRPTGEGMSLHGITWLVFRDGRVVKGWDSYDHGGMLERLWRSARAGLPPEPS